MRALGVRSGEGTDALQPEWVSRSITVLYHSVVESRRDTQSHSAFCPGSCIWQRCIKMVGFPLLISVASKNARYGPGFRPELLGEHDESSQHLLHPLNYWLSTRDRLHSENFSSSLKFRRTGTGILQHRQDPQMLLLFKQPSLVIRWCPSLLDTSKAMSPENRRPLPKPEPFAFGLELPRSLFKTA
jgi:hypothetical protein